MTLSEFIRRSFWRFLRAIGFASLSWDLQFKRGRWGSDIRSAEVTNLVQTLCQGGKLVEFGCGYGDLPRSLPPGSFSSYSGFDISRYAIGEARKRIVPRGIAHCEFTAMDMADWGGDHDVKLIVIEECLMYLTGVNLDDFLKRCCTSLSSEGLILVTVFSATKHADTIAACRRICDVVKEELVGTRTFMILRGRYTGDRNTYRLV